jgi:hypothetical protein
MKMKRIYIVLFIMFIANASAFSQTEPMYSQYMYNMLGVNPAYAGNREATSFNFNGANLGFNNWASLGNWSITFSSFFSEILGT